MAARAVRTWLMASASAEAMEACRKLMPSMSGRMETYRSSKLRRSRSLVGFDAGDELASPASEEFRGFVGGDVNDQGVQQLFGAIAGEPDEGLVDPGGAVVVDVPGLPGVPGVGGFCFESAGDADGAGHGVFVGVDGEADF